MTELAVRTRSADQTRALAQRVGAALQGGELLALCGPLGAGKTHFTQGLALGLNISGSEPVVSPTFVIARTYAGRLRLHHLDVYRLGSAAELESIGFEELREQNDAIIAIEWADRFPELLAGCDLRIEFKTEAEFDRTISFHFDAAQFPGLRPALVAASDVLAP